MKSLFLVQTNAVDGMAETFSHWYDEVHLSEVCAVPGVVSATRSAATDAGTPYRYCAVYEIDADDPTAVVAEIFRRYETGEMVRTDAMAEDMQTTLYHITKVVP